MINLRSVGKVYFTEDKKTDALKDVNINFRRSEFVCILGPSGCGKTTLLNIIGGLDRYTSGEITVDGRSTASFTDAEWDGYRSEKVGFVFQSYNLIPHQTVIENVETALAISGVGKQERRKRALKALVEVGLEEHLRKRPRQLSGGEMQRVAIARAIVKNPDIILADEPTGALDSKNSVQIMDLLARISKDRLVVTVTHNDELAKKYATRIIKISDGKVISDSDPFTGDEKKQERLQAKRSVMPYSLAAKLSFKNLMGKKVRTFLTCFASAIAIVGISLVAACSNGLNAFIDKVQKDTMSGTPVTVSASARNYTTYINSLFGYVGSGGKREITDEGEQIVIPTNSVWVNHVLKSALTERIVNFITEDYLRYLKGLDRTRVSYDAIYSASRFVYKKVSANLNGSSRQINAVVSTSNNWGQIPENTDLVFEQYEVAYGRFPKEANELALVVGKDGTISDTVLTTYFVDLYSSDESRKYYEYKDLIDKYGKFYLLSPDEYYKKDGGGEGYDERVLSIVDYIMKYYNQSEDSTGLKRQLIEQEVNRALSGLGFDCYDKEPSEAGGTELKIVCILKLKEDTQYGMFSATPICYTSALGELVIDRADRSEIVAAQKSSPNKKVVYSLDDKGEKTLGKLDSELDLRLALQSLGYAEVPTTIKFYPNKIEDKDYLLGYLDAYNDGKTEEERIEYTDNVGVAIELVRSIVGGISAVLIALTSVSLVVSAIMMGIITYVSVMERTKEIGVLRSVGARKKDIVGLFITETGMIGLAAGVFGLIMNFIAVIPVNHIFRGITGVSGFAFLTWWNAILLVVASALLTIVSGLIPALMAGKKDPVKALRSE